MEQPTIEFRVYLGGRVYKEEVTVADPKFLPDALAGAYKTLLANLKATNPKLWNNQ